MKPEVIRSVLLPAGFLLSNDEYSMLELLSQKTQLFLLTRNFHPQKSKWLYHMINVWGSGGTLPKKFGTKVTSSGV